MIQKFIDEFEILEPLGQGAQGDVFCAFDNVLRRRVALKILKSVGSESLNQARALREARSLARLHHPNIVTLFGISRAHDSHVLVMEYSEGTLLSDRLKHGPLPFPEIKAIIRQLANALYYAAAQGLSHGDIKPGNIMITNDGVAKLLDFGLATLTEADQTFATLAPGAGSMAVFEGTIAYTAPEKILGMRGDVRSDIFSLGAVLYEMITGKAPFLSSHQAATLNKILNEHPARLTTHRHDIKPWCQPLVDAMLAKDPKTRPSSLAEFAAHFAHSGVIALRRLSTDGVAPQQESAERGSFGTMKALPLAFVLTLALGGSNPVAVAPERLVPLSAQLGRGIDRLINFHEKGAIDDAEAIFGRIVAANPAHSAGNAGLALAYIRDYTSEETDPATLRRATALAAQSLASDPQLALANIAAAWAAEFNEDFARADRLYDLAERLDPGNPLALEGRARSLSKQQKLAQAEVTLRYAMRLHPANRVFFDELGATLSALGQHAEAERILRRGLVLHPDNVRGYASLSHVLYMQEKVTEAIRTAQIGLQIKPDASLYNNLGTYLFYEGLYEQAAIAFGRTLALDGNTYEFRYWANFADACRWLPGKQDEALAAYRQAIRLLQKRQEHRPHHSGINSRMAMYAAKAGDVPLARSSLARLDLPRLSNSGDLYRVAISYEVTGQRRAALHFLKRAIFAGYSKKEIANDPELAKLRQDRNYHLLMDAVENMRLGRK